MILAIKVFLASSSSTG